MDKLKFHLIRTSILKCLKILTFKFNEMCGEKDQEEFLDNLLVYFEVF